MANIAQLAEELGKLTVLEAVELVKQLEETWGVSAAAPVAMMAGPAAGPPKPSKRRPNSTSSSPIAVRTRSPSSRRCAKSLLVLASPTRRNSSKALPPRSSKASPRTLPKAPRRSSKRLVPKSSSSNHSPDFSRSGAIRSGNFRRDRREILQNSSTKAFAPIPTPFFNA